MTKNKTRARVDEDKNIIVVLGMHRSGTSAVTRGLQALGISLGNNLLPPVKGDNDKGYWEDSDINCLNIDMLNHIGHDWASLESPTEEDFQTLRTAGFLRRSRKLLEQKLHENGGIFAFKDPRTIRLLELWQEVFQRSDIQPRYVLAVRNPLSVVRSLERSRGMDCRIGYLLWLVYVMESVSKTNRFNRVVVDYDRLISDTDKSIRDIGNAFHLTVDEQQLAIFASDFVESRLRHSFFNRHELSSDDALMQLLSKAYSQLILAAEGVISSEGLAEAMNELCGKFALIKTTFPPLDQLRLSLNKELSIRSTLIEQTDQARKDQFERAEKLQGIVEEQNAELDKRLEVIEQTDQARKDQQERAEKLQGIVEEQSAELDKRLEVIAETDQARKDQQERAEILEKNLAETQQEISALRVELSVMLKNEIIRTGKGNKL